MALSATLLSHPEVAKRSELLPMCSVLKWPSSCPMLAPQEGFLPLAKIASSEGVDTTQTCKQSLLKEIDFNLLLRKFSPVALCLKVCNVSDGANRICIIIWSLGGLETLAIAQATQNTDCSADPHAGKPLQKWVYSDVVSSWWDHLYCLLITQTLALKHAQ